MSRGGPSLERVDALSLWEDVRESHALMQNRETHAVELAITSFGFCKCHLQKMLKQALAVQMRAAHEAQ